MAKVNPLVLQFLERHPSDCARVLEQLHVDTTSVFIQSVEPVLAAAVLECMMPSYGAECLRHLDVSASSAYIELMKMPRAARLLRAMDRDIADKILKALSHHVKNGMRSSLRYPDQTVGRLMDSNPFCLPHRITVAEAIKRIKHVRQRTVNEIFIVDDDHCLKGVIRVADLLSAVRTSPLEAILIRDVPFLYSKATVRSAVENTGWQTFGTLPVVEKDHTLSGILTSGTLMHYLAEARDTVLSGSMLNEVFSMTRMYWVVMAEMIDEVMTRERDQ
jgi:magnesium transporter